MCPVHIPSDNAIHPHTLLSLPFGISENVGIARHLHIDGLWSPLGAFGLLLLDVPLSVCNGVPPNMVPLHAEVLVVCSLYLSSLPKPNVFGLELTLPK
jgi:hypothetical protein